MAFGISVSPLEGLKGYLRQPRQQQSPTVTGTPQDAAEILSAGQQPVESTPDLAELFQLANRPDGVAMGQPQFSHRYESGPKLGDPIRMVKNEQEPVGIFGTAPGANEYWQNRLNQQLGEETFQRGQEQTQQKAMDSARLGGFGTPQEAAGYERQQAQQKMNVPIRQQEVQGQYDVQKQQEASRGALDVEKARQQGYEQRYGAMQDLLNTGLGQNLGSYNPQSGAMTFRQPQQVPSGISQDITTARQRLAAAKSAGGWFGPNEQQVSIAQGQLDAAVNSYLARHPAPAYIKEAARQIALDPKNAGKTAQQALADEGEDQLDPQELNYFFELYTNLAGQ